MVCLSFVVGESIKRTNREPKNLLEEDWSILHCLLIHRKALNDRMAVWLIQLHGRLNEQHLSGTISEHSGNIQVEFSGRP
jgi:hypothetical protein